MERAIERAREIRGMVLVMRHDDSAMFHAAVRGELRITIDDPGGAGRRWLLQRGFDGDEMLEYEPPRERPDAEVATLIAGAFEHALGVRATAPLDMHEYPGALPGVPLPPLEADDAIHLRAALLGPVRYGVGDVTVTCGDASAYAWVEDDALWLDDRSFPRDADGIREVAELIGSAVAGRRAAVPRGDRRAAAQRVVERRAPARGRAGVRGGRRARTRDPRQREPRNEPSRS